MGLIKSVNRDRQSIRTTVSKAKALRPFIEPLITRAKEDTEHNRRQVFRKLQNKEAVKLLFDEIGPQVGDRPGGYLRIVKLGKRSGDGTEEAIVELVDYNDVKPSTASSGSSRTRRGSGKGKRSESEETEEAAAGAA
jgi:large subunit ribosomal protein L17